MAEPDTSGAGLAQMIMLSLVIPAYNEEAAIGRIIQRVVAVRGPLQEMGVELELLVVDDGSSDGTAAVVEGHPEARLIRHRSNSGYGAALKTGFAAARGDWLGFLDADGTYPPEHLPNLCEPLMAGADLVVGSRRSGAESRMPPMRQVGNYLWSSLVTLLGNHRVADPASGMRLVRRAALEMLYPLPDGLNFTPVMSTRALHEGLRVVEVPIPYDEREGRSKLKVVRDGVRFLQTILWTSLNYNPVRVLGGVGLAAVAVAILIGCILVGMRLSGITSLGPWGVAGAFVASVLGLVGVDLLALGITFNYLVALAHRRPVRQGLFEHPILGIPLDRHFWWLGGLGVATGIGMDAISFALALGGWAIDRLWLYLLAGTMLLLLGLQLIVFWIILRVLDGLSQREVLARADIEATR